MINPFVKIIYTWCSNICEKTQWHKNDVDNNKIIGKIIEILKVCGSPYSLVRAVENDLERTDAQTKVTLTWS